MGIAAGIELIGAGELDAPFLERINEIIITPEKECQAHRDRERDQGLVKVRLTELSNPPKSSFRRYFRN